MFNSCRLSHTLPLIRAFLFQRAFGTAESMLAVVLLVEKTPVRSRGFCLGVHMLVGAAGYGAGSAVYSKFGGGGGGGGVSSSSSSIAMGGEGQGEGQGEGLSGGGWLLAEGWRRCYFFSGLVCGVVAVARWWLLYEEEDQNRDKQDQDHQLQSRTTAPTTGSRPASEVDLLEDWERQEKEEGDMLDDFDGGVKISLLADDILTDSKHHRATAETADSPTEQQQLLTLEGRIGRDETVFSLTPPDGDDRACNMTTCDTCDFDKQPLLLPRPPSQRGNCSPKSSSPHQRALETISGPVQPLSLSSSTLTPLTSSSPSDTSSSLSRTAASSLWRSFLHFDKLCFLRRPRAYFCGSGSGSESASFSSGFRKRVLTVCCLYVPLAFGLSPATTLISTFLQQVHGKHEYLLNF